MRFHQKIGSKLAKMLAQLWKVQISAFGNPVIFTSMAKKTQEFWFQISFTYLAITHASFNENQLPAPVLTTTLRCGSNGMLDLKISWEIMDLHGKMSEVACYTWLTVQTTSYAYYYPCSFQRCCCSCCLLLPPSTNISQSNNRKSVSKNHPSQLYTNSLYISHIHTPKHNVISK